MSRHPGQTATTLLTSLVACVSLVCFDGSAASAKVAKPTVLPHLSISDTSLVRPMSGDPNLTFNVTLSKVATTPVTVSYQTINDWQPVGVPGDAQGVSSATDTSGQYLTVAKQVLTIPKGKTDGTITVQALPYAPTSNPIQFTVMLSNPTGATLEDAYGTGTLLPGPTGTSFSVGIGDTSIREPTLGSRTADVTVSFSGPAPKQFRLTVASAPPTTADYIASSRTVIVKAGSYSATFPVAVLANPGNVSSTSVPVTLSTTLGTVIRAIGTLEIRGDAAGTTRAGRQPGPPRVAIMGDSIASGYTDYLKPVLEAKGYAVAEYAVPKTGLLDYNQCQGQLASSVVTSLDPDIVIIEDVGNYGYFPCTPSLIVGSPPFFTAWQAAALATTAALRSNGASVYWVLGPGTPVDHYSVTIPGTNTIYQQIASTTPNVYAIDAWTPFGGKEPDLTLRASDALHLDMAGDQLITSVIVSAIPAGVPGPPSSVTATPGNASATVTWAGPTSNGSPVTKEVVTAADTTTPANGGQTASGSTAPITITGLVNGDAYEFTVSATNGVGTGPSSSPSAPVTPATEPDPPKAVVATPDAAANGGVLEVSFATASDGGSPITNFAVTATDLSNPGDPANGMVAFGSAGPVTVIGLTSGDSYNFTVTATNRVGTSNPSLPSEGASAP